LSLADNLANRRFKCRDQFQLRQFTNTDDDHGA
jgi:hypothetical protein